MIDSPLPPELPLLPLVLWEVPPGLELMLAQEGVPFVRAREPHPFALSRGRFVVFDGRKVSRSRARATLRPGHVALDMEVLRHGEPTDPFRAVLDTMSAPAAWTVAGVPLTERVARVDRAAIWARVLDRIRRAVQRAGGVWARLGAYPYPYRSAFNFRADLDEPYPDDYRRFATARRRLADCTTHFVSTHAYGDEPAVLDDLPSYDTQSHGHYHVVYRDAGTNLRNLERAHAILARAGIDAVGFAAPGGCWTRGLDRALERLGYEYSSDFQVGHDDRPFFPWVGDRFSTVLQVPIHPVCEGLFEEAGLSAARWVGEYLAGVIRARVAAGEPAFVYGHPERRLGRYPHVLDAVAEAVAGQPFLWRVTLTAFARWWRWRAGRSWTLWSRAPGLVQLRFEDADAPYPLGVEIVRGEHVAIVPATGPRISVRLSGLAYERRRVRLDAPAPRPVRRPWSPRAAIRDILDWETVTPLSELPAGSLRDRLKRGLRYWRAKGGRA